MKKCTDENSPKGETFGERLKMAQSVQEISTYRLAELTTANRTLIGKYRSEKVMPKLDRVDELAEALGISYLWLAKGEGPMQILSTNENSLLESDTLKLLRVDLQTVRKVATEIQLHQEQRKTKLSPNQFADCIAVYCMHSIKPEDIIDDQEVIQFLKEVQGG